MAFKKIVNWFFFYLESTFTGKFLHWKILIGGKMLFAWYRCYTCNGWINFKLKNLDNWRIFTPSGASSSPSNSITRRCCRVERLSLPSCRCVPQTVPFFFCVASPQSFKGFDDWPEQHSVSQVRFHQRVQQRKYLFVRLTLIFSNCILQQDLILYEATYSST